MRVVASLFDSPSLCSLADSLSASVVLFNLFTTTLDHEAACDLSLTGRPLSKTRVITS